MPDPTDRLGGRRPCPAPSPRAGGVAWSLTGHGLIVLGVIALAATTAPDDDRADRSIPIAFLRDDAAAASAATPREAPETSVPQARPPDAPPPLPDTAALPPAPPVTATPPAAEAPPPPRPAPVVQPRPPPAPRPRPHPLPPRAASRPAVAAPLPRAEDGPSSSPPVAAPSAPAMPAGPDMGVPSADAAAAANASARWRAALAAWLEAHKTYPDTARRNGDQGRVTLRFTVERDGRVRGLQLLDGSGSDDLDAAADRMLRGATVPAFPPAMPDTSVTATVTLRYGLR